jgi:hypothetical protein
MKNFIRKAIYLGIIFGVFSFAGCQNPLAPSRETPSSTNMGRVAIVIGDSARTIAPDTEDFTKYTLTFFGSSAHESVDVIANSAHQEELPVGDWIITATGYTTGEDSDFTAVAEGSVTVTVSSSTTTNANILLKPKTGGDLAKGTFHYALMIEAYPGTGQLVITTASGEAVEGGTIELSYGYAVKEGDIELDPGQYMVRVRLAQTGTDGTEKYAGFTESLHIYSGLTSTFPQKTYTDEDFATAVNDPLDLTALVTAPTRWGTPVTTFADQVQYKGTIVWKNADDTALTGTFAADTVYKAVLTLIAAPAYTFTGFTFIGVAEDSFSHTGATSVTNEADSGVVTITFPATNTGSVTSVTVEGGNISLAQGGSKTFTATVDGSPLPPQDVTWTVTGASDAGTTIGATSGKLNIALGETAATLTVTATSVADNTKTHQAAVTVTAAVVKDIPTAVELAKIGTEDAYPLGGKYKLTGSFSLTNWTPIGTPAKPFAGVIDGNSQTITLSSFSPDALAGTHIGIFGYVKGSSTSKAGVSNLTIASSVNQSSNSVTRQAIGLLAAYAENAKLEDITLTGSFTFSAAKTVFVGGIAGYIQAGASVEGCTVSAALDIAGGAGGTAAAGVPSLAYNYVGGVAGMFSGGGEIVDCHNSGAIQSFCTVGSSQVFAGGISGGSSYGFSTPYQGKIEDCSYTGNLHAKAVGSWVYAGGIAGTIVGGGGGSDPTRIVRCFATGTVSVAGTTSGYPYIGGIVGYNYYGGLVSQSYFSGNVIADKANDYVGGIAGYNSQTSAPNNSRIEDCWTSGTVTGFNNAGGIVGQNQANTYIRRCYSRAVIVTTNGSSIGGIAGMNASTLASAITGCVALNPSLTAASGNNINRVVGSSSGTGNLINNLAWSGMTVTATGGTYTPDIGADAKGGADIATLPLGQADYAALGWEFPSVWKMGSDGYPILQWQVGTAGITADFNYGDITINGSDGSNVIYKDAARSPNRVTLSVGADYTAVKWYIDGAADPTETGNAITLNAANYSAKAHSITFTGTRGGVLYAQVLPFTVKN